MELYCKEFVFFEWEDNLKGKKGFFADTINELKAKVKNGFELLECHFSNNPTGFHFTNSSSNEAYQFFYYDPYYEFRKAYIEGKQLQFKTTNGNWVDVAGAPLFNGVDEYRIKPEWYIILDDCEFTRTKEPSENETVLFEGTEEECIKWIEKYKPFEKTLIAWKQGKPIQYKEGDEWEDWVPNEIPNIGALTTLPEWRIKDECKGCMKYNYCTNKNGIRCRNYCVKVEYVPFDTVEGLIEAWDSKYPQNKNRPEGTMPLIWIKNKQKNRVYLITDFLFEKYYGCSVGTECDNLKLKELFEDFTFLDGSIIGKVKEE